MTDVRSVLELQVESILSALRSQRDRRCREISAESRSRNRQLLKHARERTRLRLHQAVNDERRHRADALLRARQRIDSYQRRNLLAGYKEYLREVWPLLVAELERRWSDDEGRRLWCEMAIREARVSLPHEEWIVELSGTWPAGDNDWLMTAFCGHELPGPELRIGNGLPPGVRIRCGDACLDATLDGLLERRTEIEARLLAAWERQLAEPGNAT
jgi:hypothetical protein